MNISFRPIRSVFRFVVIAIAFAWLGWQILLGISPAQTGAGAPGIGRAPESAGAAALTRLAERLLLDADGEPNWAEVERVAKSATVANPLHARAIALVGASADARGEVTRAQDLMELAGKLSLRDPIAHLWLFDRRLSEGKFSEAVGEADVVLRSHPEFREKLVQPLVRLAQRPEGVAALVAGLETNPSWRGWYLRELVRRSPGHSATRDVYVALEATEHPPTTSELRPAFDRLIEAELFEQAFFMWTRQLSAEERASLDYLYNGDFHLPVSELPFDWQISEPRGVDVSLVDRADGAGRALQLQFYRGRIPFRHVRKLMLLPSGHYVLEGRARAEGFETRRGLAWRISCAGGASQTIAESERLSGTAEWHSFRVEFEVPADGCRAQWLRLELAARVPLEQDVDGGTVWYEQLGVQRVSFERGKVTGAAVEN